MRYVLLTALCAALVTPTLGLAQASAKDGAVAQRLAEVRATAACTPQAITCGSTVNGTLASGGCTLPDGTPVQYYQFAGTVSESVTGTLTSTEFDPVLELLNPSGDVLTSSSDFQGPGTVTVPSSLNAAGNWTWAVTNTSASQSGNYTFKFTCGSTTTNCPNDPNTLCLSNGRFQVRATFNAGASGSGNANAVQLTSDTGYLWFFSSTNVEAVIKVLDGCPVDNAYWVFAGGLTNVNTVITVTDLQTNATKTYTNPANTEFQPIQDTSAFATCP